MTVGSKKGVGLHHRLSSWNIIQKNCRVYRSADCGNNTDHRLVAAICSLRLKRCSTPQDTAPRIAVEKFRSPATQQSFELKLQNRFALLYQSGDFASSTENLWNEDSKALKETSHAVLGPRRRKKHQWISDATLGTIDEHRTARLCGNTIVARRLATKRKQQLRRDETASRRGRRSGQGWEQWSTQPTIRTMTGQTASKLSPATAKDGSRLYD